MGNALSCDYDHSLELRDQRNSIRVCSICTLELGGPLYICNSESELCIFEIHKSCLDLPKETIHPLHAHPLTLLSKPPDGQSFLVCNECREFCYTYAYHCASCQFTLDVKCSFLSPDQCKKLKEGEVKCKIFHFSDEHILSLSNCKEEFKILCSACYLPLSGLAYSCTQCLDVTIHESCVKLPSKIKHPYHQQHLLYARSRNQQCLTCKACNGRILGFSYECFECRFGIHYQCSNPSTSAIKVNQHEHNLFYFESTGLKGGSFKCNTCEDTCSTAFYRCLDCDFNIHSRCVPIPPVIKHDHMHPLTYSEPCEDASAECYCHACETERDPRFPFYKCEKCHYTAHVGCIVSERTYIEETVIKKMEQERSANDIALAEVDKNIAGVVTKIEDKRIRIEAMKAHLGALRTTLKALEEELADIQAI